MGLSLIGTKSGMTSVYDEAGARIPVTVLHIEPNTVIQVKTSDNDGYRALKVSVGKQKKQRLSKPVLGQYKFKSDDSNAETSVQPGLLIKEIRLNEGDLPDVKQGDALVVADHFEVGQFVDVTGVSKGKGFAGTVKRHNFSMQDATHGNSLSHRAPGFYGPMSDSGRVFKGKKNGWANGWCAENHSEIESH